MSGTEKILHPFATEMRHLTSALNVIQRLGGAVGTALFAIVLSRQAGAGAGGAGALAGAFGTTFWVAAGLIAAAVVPALLLPRARRQT